MPAHLRALIPGMLAAVIAIQAPARALDVDVPTGQPTIQAALTAITAKNDPLNTINIVSSPLTVSGEITLDANINSQRKLLIRPKPGVLSRAVLVSNELVDPIISMTATSYMTLRDLDILTVLTSNGPLLKADHASSIVIERCRIGSTSPPSGPGSFSNLEIFYPIDFTVRNCIFFSSYPGKYASGITASYGDISNSLRLYNNVVANYRLSGVHIVSDQIHSLVLLRNNVIVNDVNVTPEPVAVITDVGPDPTVVTSHNTAFASGGRVESFPQPVNQDIAGSGAGQALEFFPPPDAAGAFVTEAWVANDPNPNFFRPVSTGELHSPASAWGVTVGTGAPAPGDFAVIDDINASIRPGGTVLHTDRGAYQLDPGTSAAAVGELDASAGLLSARPVSNPASQLTIAYTIRVGGTLRLEVLSTDGRRLYSTEREVGPRSSGTLGWVHASASGWVAYKLTLKPRGGSAVSVRGRVLIVK